MRDRHVVVVGDALLDRDVDGRADRLAPDAAVPVIDDPSLRARPGGAALAAALAARDGAQVTLITALGSDGAGQVLRRLLARCGVAVHDLGLDGRTPEKIRVCAAGRPVVRVDLGGEPGYVRPPTAVVEQLLAAADAVLVADYGRGVTAKRRLRTQLEFAARAVPTVWDPHPRGAHPVAGVRLATPNRRELAHFAPPVEGDGLAALTAAAEALRERWRAHDLAVTLGERGALLVTGGGAPMVTPAPEVSGGDACGAGDRFAARAATALAAGALPSEAVAAAVTSAAEFVRRGGAFAFRVEEAAAAAETVPGATELAERVRAGGGTVVATGGCFDLLHAGHVRILEAARRLGDCLVVCLNSDASVHRLKGPGRPLVPQHDRASVLLGLACVDAVVIFDEDTPESAIRRLRPDVWAKGGDYRVADLPEASVLREWGGQAVVLPFVPGRSTTTIIEEARRRAHV